LFAKITYSRDDHCNLGYVFPGVDGGDDGGDTRESGRRAIGGERGGQPPAGRERTARGVANECAKERACARAGAGRARRDIIIAVT